MKLTKKYLNEHKIFNPHNLASVANSKIYIGYIPQDTGRGGHGAKWQVVGIKFNTDPKSAWYDNYCKTFDLWDRTEKNAKLQEAIKWVKDTYNIEITDKDPFGAWHPKGTREKLIKILEGK